MFLCAKFLGYASCLIFLLEKYWRQARRCNDIPFTLGFSFFLFLPFLIVNVMVYASYICLLQLIDGDGVFSVTALENFMKEVRLGECGLSYVAVSIMGPAK